MSSRKCLAASLTCFLAAALLVLSCVRANAQPRYGHVSSSAPFFRSALCATAAEAGILAYPGGSGGQFSSCAPCNPWTLLSTWTIRDSTGADIATLSTGGAWRVAATGGPISLGGSSTTVPAMYVPSGTNLRISVPNASTLDFTDSANALAVLNDLGTVGRLDINGLRVGSATATIGADSAPTTTLVDLTAGKAGLRDATEVDLRIGATDRVAVTATTVSIPSGTTLQATGGVRPGLSTSSSLTRTSGGSDATINWGATASFATDTLTMTSVGDAAVGDACVIGVTTTAPTDSALWCSVTTASTTAPTITLYRRCVNSVACTDPAADTYRVRTYNP